MLPPPPPARVCLNMIVKNERANILRALRSAAPEIDCWVIADTGSTDGTDAAIVEFFKERGIPGALVRCEFRNFGQARNDALIACEDYAKEMEAAGADVVPEYALLMDADMELVRAPGVEAGAWKAGLEAPQYLVNQDNGQLRYLNVRLARIGAGLRYVGVTHEYLDGPGPRPTLHQFAFVDHETGANRPNKFRRDRDMLLGELEGGVGDEGLEARYWFYLAQSCRDMGDQEAAAWCYRKRASFASHFPEEVWFAMLQEAACLHALERAAEPGGREAWECRRAAMDRALEAFVLRPWRAEPLLLRSRILNANGMHREAMAEAEKGFSIPYPRRELLFVDRACYEYALVEEHYQAAMRLRDATAEEKLKAFAMCDYVALHRSSCLNSRTAAAENLAGFAPTLGEVAPSFLTGAIGFVPPPGWRAMNPSVAVHMGRVHAMVRTVNYTINPDGSYDMPPDRVVRTRNWLLVLDDGLSPTSASEVLMPEDWPDEVPFGDIRGLEDCRLFEGQGSLWASATCCELTPSGRREMVLARISRGAGGTRRFQDVARMRAGPRGPGNPGGHEKNWMPIAGGPARFVYSLDPPRVVGARGEQLHQRPAAPLGRLERLRGGSQCIPWRDGLFLALTHEVAYSGPRRRYTHRFVLLDGEGVARMLSRPFYFTKRNSIEFAAGLCRHPGEEGKLVLSFGLEDAEAYVGTISSDDVERLLARSEND